MTVDDFRRQLALERQRCEERMAELSTGSSELAKVAAERDALRVKIEELEKLSTPGRFTEEELREMAAAARAAQERARELEAERDEIRRRFAQFAGGDQLGVDLTPLGVRITVQDAILFPSGQAHLIPSAVSLLDQVAEVLASSDATEIRVVGHTDKIPIHTPEFPSNWELSTARANAVLRRLLSAHSLAPERFAVIGYGPHRPIADNSTSPGRAQNRRVEIYLVR